MITIRPKGIKIQSLDHNGVTHKIVIGLDGFITYNDGKLYDGFDGVKMSHKAALEYAKRVLANRKDIITHIHDVYI